MEIETEEETKKTQFFAFYFFRLLNIVAWETIFTEICFLYLFACTFIIMIQTRDYFNAEKLDSIYIVP